MQLYVFLTNSIRGYTGGPSYVRNKKEWLTRKGWKVVVFESGGGLSLEEDIYDELNEYKNNRISELFYFPSNFTKGVRIRVLSKIISVLEAKPNDKIVIESNTDRISVWGEYLAILLKAKHLIFLIGENSKIEDNQLFDFFYHKYKYNELFSIKPEGFDLLFSKYLKINDSQNHYWNALSLTTPKDYVVPELMNLPKADFNICHFGRFKDYIPFMIDELIILFRKYKYYKFNLIFWGINKIDQNTILKLSSYDNLRLFLFPARYPIPKALFQMSDVVIATSGCASISFLQDSKTISMDVNTNKPLGIMGYTTNMSTYSSNKYPDIELPLNKVVEDVLINKKFDYPPPIEFFKNIRGYDYQLSCIDGKGIYYEGLSSIKGKNTIKSLVLRIILKFGFLKSIVKFNTMRFKEKY